MPSREINRMLIILIYLAILACQGQAQAKQKTPNIRNQDEMLETLRRYVQLRLSNADWKEYSKFITWSDEPSWDCNWVVGRYDIGTPKKDEAKVIVPVVDKRLGLFCYDFEFKTDPKVVTINYELVRRPSGWKVNAPIPDYPDISAEVLIKSLKASAADLREPPERRTQFRTTSQNVAAALNRAGDSQQ
jgi:hypothetical protein